MEFLRKVIFCFLVGILLLAFIQPLGAQEINLPQEVRAKAWIMRSSKDGLWEKTLIVKFSERRRMLSTLEGFLEGYAAVNYSAHPEFWKKICEEKKNKNESGGMVHLREVREKIAKSLEIKATEVAILGTAADMDNLAVVTKVYKPLVVVALVTAGAKSNALRTGLDEGNYIEGKEPQGTVNIILLTNAYLTDGAMARAIITATEAKTAAFQDLQVPSSYTKGALATGTGTDNIIIVSGIEGPRVTYTGGHSKMGELIGKAVYEAVIEALIKQNGFKRPKN